MQPWVSSRSSWQKGGQLCRQLSPWPFCRRWLSSSWQDQVWPAHRQGLATGFVCFIQGLPENKGMRQLLTSARQHGPQ